MQNCFMEGDKQTKRPLKGIDLNLKTDIENCL